MPEVEQASYYKLDFIIISQKTQNMNISFLQTGPGASQQLSDTYSSSVSGTIRICAGYTRGSTPNVCSQSFTHTHTHNALMSGDSRFMVTEQSGDNAAHPRCVLMTSVTAAQMLRRARRCSRHEAGSATAAALFCVSAARTRTLGLPAALSCTLTFVCCIRVKVCDL